MKKLLNIIAPFDTLSENIYHASMVLSMIYMMYLILPICFNIYTTTGIN